jgi:uncharacterized protein involved in type VI secretion and phage assembly
VADSILDLLSAGRDETVPTSRIYGAVVGIVTNNDDPEKLGRVKVKFPWMALDQESHWARIATLDAGKDRGTWWIPEVNDEVLCVFEHGDINFPYVIGMLWNGKDTPPKTFKGQGLNAEKSNDMRFLRSRSGHLLVFDDTSGRERIEIIDKTNERSIEIDVSGRKIIITNTTGDIEVKAPTGRILLEGKQVEIKSTTDTKVTAGTTMDVKSTAPMTIKTHATMSIEAMAPMSIKSNATMDVNGGALLKIQAGLVMIN